MFPQKCSDEKQDSVDLTSWKMYLRLQKISSKDYIVKNIVSIVKTSSNGPMR